MYFSIFNRKILILVLSVLGLLGLGVAKIKAQEIPYIGHTSSKLWGKNQELDIGQATYNHLLSQGRIVLDLPDQDYIDYLGNSIGTFANTRVGLNFFLTNAKSINAFAGIGGYIGINAGLVIATDNEHELAGVLAHEITHVSQEHIARSIISAQDRRLVNVAGVVAGALVATQTSSGDAGAGIMSAVIANETQQQLNDIRSHEKEADRLGRGLMQKAGFSELGMQTFFAKLNTPDYANKIPSYLLTHPLPQDRQADIDRLQQKSQRLKSSDEYYLFRARLRSKLLNKEEMRKIIKQDKVANQRQIVDSAHYADALFSMKYGNLVSARHALDKLSARFKSKRDVQLLKAKLALVSGQSKQAGRLYEMLWKKYSNDGVLAYDYAHYLKSKKNYQKAIKILDKQIKLGSQRAQIYQLYGSLLEITGDRTKQQTTLIDYYRLTGNYEKAATQVKIALNYPNLDWRAKASLKSKQDEIQMILENIKNR